MSKSEKYNGITLSDLTFCDKVNNIYKFEFKHIFTHTTIHSNVKVPTN